MATKDSSNFLFLSMEMLTRGISSFILSPIILLALGDNRFALWATASTFASTVSLADLGIRSSYIHRLTHALNRGPDRYYHSVFESGNQLCKRIGALTLLISTTLTFATLPIADYFKVSQTEYCFCLFVVGATVSIKILFFKYEAILWAKKRLDVIAKTGLIINICTSISVFYTIRMTPSITTLALIHGCGAIISVAGIYWQARPLIPHSKQTTNKKLIRQILKVQGLRRLINKSSNHITWQIDTLTVGITSGVAPIAGYSLAASINQQFLAGESIYSGVVNANVTKLAAQRKHRELAGYLLQMSKWVITAMLPLGIISCLYAKQFFTLWISDEEFLCTQRPWMIYSAIVIASISFHAVRPAALALQAHGHLKLVSHFTMLEGAINALLSLLLGYRFGALGVASATALTAITISLPIHFVYTMRHILVGMAGQVINCISRILACGVGLVAYILVFQDLHSPNSWIELTAHGLAAFAMWLILIYLIAMDRLERSVVNKKIKSSALNFF